MNASLAAKLLDSENKKKELHHIDSDDEKDDDGAAEPKDEDTQRASSVLTDPRFAKMFESMEYNIDEESEVRIQRVCCKGSLFSVCISWSV